MDQEVVNSLGKLKLTKEEEKDIVIANINSSEIFEECSLSLFGHLLSSRHQNLSFKEHFKGNMENEF